jgi:hypothetical protein
MFLVFVCLFVCLFVSLFVYLFAGLLACLLAGLLVFCLLKIFHSYRVLLICWFGTQLTQHVRKNGVFFSCCAGANISHVGAIEYLINKDLFMFLKH